MSTLYWPSVKSASSFIHARNRMVAAKRDSSPSLPGRIHEHNDFVAGWRQLSVEKPSPQLSRFAATIFAAIGREFDAASLSQLSVCQKPNHLHPIAGKIRARRRRSANATWNRSPGTIRDRHQNIENKSLAFPPLGQHLSSRLSTRQLGIEPI